MNSVNGYKNTPNYRIQGWGQGLGLVFLSSVIKAKDNTEQEMME